MTNTNVSAVDFAGEVRASLRYLGGNMIKLDGLINHQVSIEFMAAAGVELARRFREAGVQNITKVVTAEASGITPAFTTAQALDVPMIYARKGKPATMTEAIHSVAVDSRTKGGSTELFLSGEYLTTGDRVVLVDDILGRGQVVVGLAEMIGQIGASLHGVGFIVEKCFEHGRPALEILSVPIVSLVKVDLLGDSVEVT